MRVWLGLGSNLGDRESNLRRALELLQTSDLKIERVSPIYETAPQGYLEQDWFLNLVAAAETSLAPLEVLECCEAVEARLKRQRAIRNGPRTIDIDLLFYGDQVISNSRLKVPHPRYAERRFVLQPLADLEPGFRDPVNGRSVAKMLAAVDGQNIQRYVGGAT